MKTFIEPGSGITMLVNKWYILSDSGSQYTDTGFHTALEAMFWMGQNAKDHNIEYTDIGVVKHEGQLNMADLCNIVQGKTLLKFWKEEELK
jgi:hypothetical protein